MFTDSKKSAVKIADWGLVKIEEPFTKDLENTAAPISAVSTTTTTTTTTTTDIDRRSLELTAVLSEGNIGGIS